MPGEKDKKWDDGAAERACDCGGSYTREGYARHLASDGKTDNEHNENKRKRRMAA